MKTQVSPRSYPKIEEDDFYKTINEAIDAGRHPEQLKQIIKEYEEYKKFFETVFTAKNPAHSVYVFRITYLDKKFIWREFEIYGGQNFALLAETIVDSMGWMYDHMHGFRFIDPRSDRRRFPNYEFFHPDWEDDQYPTYKSNQIKIGDLDYDKNLKLRFTFDYGDCHEFEIRFKNIRPLKTNETVEEFPKLIDQRGVAPEQYPMPDEE